MMRIVPPPWVLAGNARWRKRVVAHGRPALEQGAACATSAQSRRMIAPGSGFVGCLKGRGDLERLVAVRGEQLDHEYIRRRIVEMMGEADERVRAWDDMVTRFGAAS